VISGAKGFHDSTRHQLCRQWVAMPMRSHSAGRQASSICKMMLASTIARYSSRSVSASA